MTWTFSGVDEFASFLLRRGGVECHPVPIEQLALRLGADRVITERLDGEEGRLELRGSEVVIVAHADASPARRRFTIAHEIGHLVLADPRYELGSLRSQPALRSEERLCDRIAEALLMPAGWISERYSAAPQRLSTLLDCTRAFDVSAAAATLRLTRLTTWSRALLRFNAYRGPWQLAGVTGWSPERRESVRAIEPTGRVLERFAHPGSLSRLWLPLGAGEHHWLVGAELWGREGWALALVDPRRRRACPRSERPSSASELADPSSLKLFYSLDDIDACILPLSINREGNNGRDRHTQTGHDQPLAA